MTDAAQIIEPQKPGSASVRPNAQKTCAARNVFKEEVIKRQQHSDIHRRLAFLSIGYTNKDSSLPTISKSDSVVCGILSMLVYGQSGVNASGG